MVRQTHFIFKKSLPRKQLCPQLSCVGAYFFTSVDIVYCFHQTGKIIFYNWYNILVFHCMYMYLDNIYKKKNKKNKKKHLSHQLCKHVVKINVGQGMHGWLIHFDSCQTGYAESPIIFTLYICLSSIFERHNFSNSLLFIGMKMVRVMSLYNIAYFYWLVWCE